MAIDATGRALNALRQLDEYGRRKEVERLIDTQVLELNGFTLYKYHMLPQICSESRGSKSLPVHFAQVRVGLRWSYFLEEEEDYWAAQMTKLREGSILPLEPLTYQKFVFRSSFEAPAPILTTHLEPPPPTTTPKDGQALFAKHAKATLGCLDNTMAAGIDLEQLWTLLPGTEQDFWRKVAAALPEEADDQSAGAAPELVLGCRSTTDEIRRSQAPEPEASSASSETFEDTSDKTVLSPQAFLHSRWAPSNQAGSTHEYADQLSEPQIKQEYQERPQSPLKRKAISAQGLAQSCWAPTIKNNEVPDCRNEHAFLTLIGTTVDPRPPKKKLRYDPEQQQTFNVPSTPRHIHRNSLAEVSLAELQASARFPILHMLTSGRVACLDYAPMVDTILASIESIIECYPGMKLDGRHSGVRVSFR